MVSVSCWCFMAIFLVWNGVPFFIGMTEKAFVVMLTLWYSAFAGMTLLSGEAGLSDHQAVIQAAVSLEKGAMVIRCHFIANIIRIRQIVRGNGV